MSKEREALEKKKAQRKKNKFKSNLFKAGSILTAVAVAIIGAKNKKS